MRPSIPGEDDPFLGTREEIPQVAISGTIASVDTKKGTVGVRMGRGIGHRPDVKIPMFQLSFNLTASSWFRFMPQVGDNVTLVQNVDGSMHIVNYECLNYQQLSDADSQDEFLFRELKQGEFEVRSSGLASIFGSKTGTLRLAGGPATLTLNRKDQAADLSAPFIRMGALACEIRFGEVRRRVLPTDFEETALPGGAGTLREFRLVVAREAGPVALPMVEVALGDVLTETAPVYPPALSGFGSPVRAQARVFDPTGLLALFGLRVDALGNLEVVQGPTPTGQMTIQPGLSLRLGGPAAAEPVPLGLVLNTFLTNLITALQGAVVQTAVGPGTFNPATIAALAALLPQLPLHLSTVVYTQLTPTPGAP